MGPLCLAAAMSEIDLDPTIKAFECLSDRVSNVEECLGALLEATQHHYQQRIGHIPSSLFGFPKSCDVYLGNEFQVGFEPAHLNDLGSRQFRTEAAILDFSIRDCVCPDKFTFDVLPKPRSYYEELDDNQEGHLTTHQEALESPFQSLDEEIMRRVICNFDLPERFRGLSLINAYHKRSFTVGVLSTDHSGCEMIEYLSLAKTILSYLHPARSCWKEIIATDVRPAPLQHHVLSQWISNCKDDSKKQEWKQKRDALPSTHTSRVEYLESHSALWVEES